MREQFECAQDSKPVRLAIAAVWFAGGMVFWLLSLGGIHFAERTGIALTITAVLILFVNAIVRLPILCNDSTNTDNYDHAIYLLTFAAVVNWLGAIAANGRTLNDILPAVILAAFGEIWFLRKALQQGKLQWLAELQSKLLAQANVHGPNTQSRALRNSCDGECDGKNSDVASRLTDHDEDLQEKEDENVVHRTVAGTDPEGQAYVSGESVAVFEVGQTSTAIIVAFSPPFPNQPEIETECEEEVDIQVLNCTPIGCRMEIKRRDKTSSQKLIVGWYATSTLDDAPAKSLILP